jgi:uncharacterized ParB-like nuclease family protein
MGCVQISLRGCKYFFWGGGCARPDCCNRKGKGHMHTITTVFVSSRKDNLTSVSDAVGLDVEER